jgi:hypothetical protein
MTNLNDIDRRLAEARARQSARLRPSTRPNRARISGGCGGPPCATRGIRARFPAHEAEAIRAAFEPVLLYVLLVLVAGGLYGFSQGGGGRAAGFALIALAAGLSSPCSRPSWARANHAAGAGHGSSDGSAGPGHGDGHGHREAAQDDRAPLAAAPARPGAPAAAPVAAAPAERPRSPWSRPTRLPSRPTQPCRRWTRWRAGSPAGGHHRGGPAEAPPQGRGREGPQGGGPVPDGEAQDRDSGGKPRDRARGRAGALRLASRGSGMIKPAAAGACGGGLRLHARVRRVRR